MASENSSISSLGLRREIKRPRKHDGDEVAYIGVGRRVISSSHKQKKDSDSDYEPESTSDDQYDTAVNSSLKAVTKNVDKPSEPDKRQAGPATADDDSLADRFGRVSMTRVGDVGASRGRELAVSASDDEYVVDEKEILPRGPRVTKPSQPIPYQPFNPFKAAIPSAFPTKDRITEAPAAGGSATFEAASPVQPWVSDTVKESSHTGTSAQTSPQGSSNVVIPLVEAPTPPLTRPTPAQLRRINTAYNSLKQAQSDPKCLQYLGVTFTPDGKPIHDLSVAVSKHFNPSVDPDFNKSHKPFPTPAADGAKSRARNQDAFQTLHPMLKNLIVSELLDDSASELVASMVASVTMGLPVITVAVVEQLLGVERSVIEGAKEEAAKLREEGVQEKSVPKSGDVVAALRWLTGRGLPRSLVCLYSELYDIDVSEPVGGNEVGIVSGGEEMEKQDSGVGVAPKKARRG